MNETQEKCQFKGCTNNSTHRLFISIFQRTGKDNPTNELYIDLCQTHINALSNQIFARVQALTEK